jgi:hypothetical protein
MIKFSGIAWYLPILRLLGSKLLVTDGPIFFGLGSCLVQRRLRKSYGWQTYWIGWIANNK